MAKNYQRLWDQVTSGIDEAKSVRTLAEIVVDEEGRAFISRLDSILHCQCTIDIQLLRTLHVPLCHLAAVLLNACSQRSGFCSEVPLWIRFAPQFRGCRWLISGEHGYGQSLRTSARLSVQPSGLSGYVLAMDVVYVTDEEDVAPPLWYISLPPEVVAPPSNKRNHGSQVGGPERQPETVGKYWWEPFRSLISITR